jgi:hypothetical protein
MQTAHSEEGIVKLVGKLSQGMVPAKLGWHVIREN